MGFGAAAPARSGQWARAPSCAIGHELSGQALRNLEQHRLSRLGSFRITHRASRPSSWNGHDECSLVPRGGLGPARSLFLRDSLIPLDGEALADLGILAFDEGAEATAVGFRVDAFRGPDLTSRQRTALYALVRSLGLEAPLRRAAEATP